MLGVMDAPVAERDYPRTLREFNAWFADEAACLDYLARLRWPGGFVCPACGGQRFWRMSKGRNLRCAGCRADASVTAGTIFADTRLPLAIWFAAAWYATGTKHGVSALSLQRVLGLGSYETAWSLLHKLRRAMGRPGRGAEKKTPVLIAVEKRGLGMGRVRFAPIADTSGDSLLPAIEDLIEPGSVVATDGHAGYNGVTGAGYAHDRHRLYATGDPAHVAMPRVHRVASLLQRWLLGTHQGAVRPQQLDYYLDEYTFRFNRRGSNHRGLLFYRLLEQAVQVEPTPLAKLLGGAR